MNSVPHEIALPVHLDTWTVSASIDFLSLTNLTNDQRHALKQVLEVRDTCVKLAQDGGRNVITVHDPTLAQLQQIIDTYPNASIYAIEFSVDLRPSGETDLSELAPVYKWFADALYPVVPKAKRYMCDLTAPGPKKPYIKAPDGPCDTITTIVWRDVPERVKQKLYIKDRDGNRVFERPCVRLEATLSMGGCSDVGLAKAWQLATFGDHLRRVLSPCFQIADGIKPKLKRARHKPGSDTDKKTRAYNERQLSKTRAGWDKGGAMWAAKRAYAVHPHHEARRRIGDALHRLGKQLTKLKLSENSREVMEHVSAENRMLLEVDDFRASSLIRGEDIPYRTYTRRKF
ncbi:hypothetical protein SAMN05428966_102375 [Massilia sp. PDC64]|nr:hypothetical protein [Massilia sp. PDC64]SDC80516.1 hypothetical protein SAMN05428966_102375 [Massilia sp. PDC64]